MFANWDGAGERHVMPDQRNGGWKVVAPAAEAEHHLPTQSDAIEEACTELQRNGGGEVLIHGVRGRLQDRRTVPSE